MASKLKVTKNLPSYLEKSSKGGLLTGFIYVIAFMSILFLIIWQTFESENNKSSMKLVDERLSLIEEQINIVDETNNDSMTDITSSIQFLDKEIRKLVDEGYNQARKILTEKIDDLHKVAKALLTYETLTGEEIENIINKNIYPTNKEDAKSEDSDQSSALGSIGLKPKIVH